MVTFVERLKTGAIQTLKHVPIGLAIGYLYGYAYSKLADLPASQAAKAWAVYTAAAGLFVYTIPSVLTENARNQNLMRAVALSASASLFIRQMRQWELLGNKMMYLMIATTVISTAGCLVKAAGFSNGEQLGQWLDKKVSR